MATEISRSECEAFRSQMKTWLKINPDIEAIKLFNNDYQVKAYFRMKRNQEVTYAIKNLSRIVGGISSIVGAITILIELFV